jgi:hypothetical protein
MATLLLMTMTGTGFLSGNKIMSKVKLDYAMKMYMQRLVRVEGRPFCFRDFLDFEVDGKKYNMSHGTFRNKISKLMNDGFVKLQYCSGPAFYSLKGNTFTKHKREMTDNHTMVSPVSSMSSVSFIDNLPADKHAIHDIRYRFKVIGIWSIIVSNYPELKPNDRSKDISLSPIETNDLMIRVVIHHTDTVSVSVGCSMKPVVSDIGGLIRLSNALTRVEERVSRLLDVRNQLLLSPKFHLIPEHNSWIVTMWHFGKDSLNEYTGERFEHTWEQGKEALIRVYTKDLRDGKGIRIRTERQEYPNKRFDEAIEEKLNALGSS